MITALDTERLHLRCPTRDDGRVINAAVRASWPELSMWMHWAAGAQPTVEDTTARAASRAEAYAARTEFAFAGFEKAGGDFVGLFALQDFDWAVPRGEIGGWLVSAKTRQGFAVEMVRAIVAAGAGIGLRRIEWRCDVNNVRSRAVAERTGFDLEGIMRNHTLTPQGGLRDTCLFARVFPGLPHPS